MGFDTLLKQEKNGQRRYDIELERPNRAVARHLRVISQYVASMLPVCPQCVLSMHPAFAPKKPV